ncbi:MAG: UUP1 family membrane protein [Myxococcota bacterium]
MNRAVIWTAAVLILLGGSTFVYKHLVLGMELRLDPRARVWRVEMEVTALGQNRRGRIELTVPSADDQQVLLDEQTFDDGLSYRLDDRTEPGRDRFGPERRATWSGRIEETKSVAFTYRVHLPELPEGTSLGSLGPPPPDEKKRRRPAVPPAVAEMLARLGIEEGDDSDAIIASSFGFVAHEVEAVNGGSDDPRIVLRAREGSEIGKSRLLVALLEGAGVDARIATGVRLRAAGRVGTTRFVEAWTRGEWIPLMVSSESPSEFPSDFVVLARGDRPLVATNGITSSHLDVQVMRESLRPSELASFVSPKSPFWRAMSLYRLPLETQSILRILLLIPAAVLIAAAFRNLIGIRTFGTFMPLLIALSLRQTTLSTGLLLVSAVLSAGVVSRLLLDRLRLLFVPRLCLLLCVVILFVMGLAQLGYEVGGRGLMSGLLFPIVIFAMLIERISVTTLEEGWQSSLKLMAGSFLLSALAYPIFRSAWLEHIFFGFPELILCVMGLLVLIGGYTGYRVAELWRFRSLVREDALELNS